MARWWKTRSGDQYRLVTQGNLHKSPFRYYVYVCTFTFVFDSLDQITRTIEHYETKILPSSRIPNFVPGSKYGDHEECQRWHERLPLRLREGTRRQKVINALKAALVEFQRSQSL